MASVDDMLCKEMVMKGRCKSNGSGITSPKRSHGANCTPRTYSNMWTESHPLGKTATSALPIQIHTLTMPIFSSLLDALSHATFSPSLRCVVWLHYLLHLTRLAISIQISLTISGVHQYDHRALLFQGHRNRLSNTVQGRSADEIGLRAATPVFSRCCRRGRT